MAKVITVANQKGGVGKTSTVLCLGAVLKSRGYKVLYVDLDKQSNTSTSLRANTKKRGSYEILTEKASAKELIQVTANNDYVITASDTLDSVDSFLNDVKNGVGKEFRLRNSLKDVATYFDFIIIDTPPSLNNATVNALTTTDYLVVVSNADTFSIEGIKFLYGMCDSVKEYTNPNLKIGGIAITRYNGRSVLSKDLKDRLDNLANEYETKVYSSVIRECIAIRESQELKEDIVTYAPKSNAVADYTALTEEILKDLEG